MILNILFGLGFIGMAIIAATLLRDNRKLSRQNSGLHDGLRQAGQLREGATAQITQLQRELEFTRDELKRRKELHSMIDAGDVNLSRDARLTRDDMLARPATARKDTALHIGGFAVTQLDSDFPATRISGFPDTTVEAPRR